MADTADKIGHGVFWSIRKRADTEISEHMAKNRRIRLHRHALWQRVLRFLIDRRFRTFIITYILLDLALELGALALYHYNPEIHPVWRADGIKGLLKDHTGFLLSVQVGMIGVISVAVGLVTLIAQRNDGAATNADIRIYYSEALAYGVAASGIALLAVMTVQLFWPVQFLAHSMHFESQKLLIKTVLTAVHIGWLALNLVAFAQFIAVSLRFVEPKARERMRETYTANTLLPQDIHRRLRSYLLLQAAQSIKPPATPEDDLGVSMGGFFGLDNWDEEISVFHRKSVELYDIRLRPLAWILKRWWKSSTQTEPARRPFLTRILRPRKDSDKGHNHG
jgi:hypothetical protein